MSENKNSRSKKWLVKLISLLLVVGVLLCLYNYTNILSGILHKKYDITFVVEDKSYTQKVEYNTLPVFEGNPTKAPTNTIEYVFDSWQPELQKVESDATYVAKFKEQERLYSVLVDSNYSGGATYTGVGKLYPYQQDATISLSVNTGYTFLGWYQNGEFISNELSINLETIEADIVLETKFETIKKTITYNNLKGATNVNPEEYDVTFGTFELSRLKAEGFYFVGWYTGENGTGTKVESIDSTELENYVLYAHWSLEAPVNLNVDGKKVHSIESYIGEEITLNKINQNFSPESFGMAGYSVKKWYADENLTHEFEFGSTLSDELTLYGTYEYFMNEIYFYPYLEEFNNAVSTLQTVKIGSRNELLGWIDYVRFYDISKKIGIKLEYHSSNTQAIVNEITDAYYELVGGGNYTKVLSSFETNSTFQPVAIGSIGHFYVTKSYVSTEATMVADENKTNIYEQQDYALQFVNENKRLADFDDFKLNNVVKSIPVSTSEQLVHALMSGYNVSPIAGSKAEIVYNKAKAVLLEICNDSMTDFDKLRSIYEWLVMNVEYDNKALEISETGISITELMKYDAWYAEGVFNNGVAVCEGYAKALVILAKLENIPTIIVSGDSHAWNKVLFEGEWYGVDATHGSPSVRVEQNHYEIFTYNQFMFTDEFKTTCGYTNDDYLEYAAETENAFNIYDSIEFSYNFQTFDLYIDVTGELEMLLGYAEECAIALESETQYVTLEFAVGASYTNYYVDLLFTQACNVAGVSAELWLADVDSLGNKVYTVKIAV